MHGKSKTAFILSLNEAGTNKNDEKCTQRDMGKSVDETSCCVMLAGPRQTIADQTQKATLFSSLFTRRQK